MLKTEEEEFQEAQSGFTKFENPGDEVVGTYIEKISIPAKGIYPEQIGYLLKTDGGETVAAFNIVKKWVHSAMKGAKYGQRVKFSFDNWFETDAYKKELERVGDKPEDCKISRAKTIKVYLGRMDQEFLDGFDITTAKEKEIGDVDFT